MKNEDTKNTKPGDIDNPSKTTDSNVPNEKIPGTQENAFSASLSPQKPATYLKSIHFRAILVGVRFLNLSLKIHCQHCYII